MDDADPAAPAGGGDVLHPRGVDGKAALRVAFRPVHIGVGGGIDHHLGFFGGDELPAGIGGGEVEIFDVLADDGVKRSQPLHQRGPEHSLVTQDKYLHEDLIPSGYDPPSSRGVVSSGLP